MIKRANLYHFFCKRKYNKFVKTQTNEAEYVVNLRSDTFTTPCEEMRDAMRSASVGDDVWEEDPTVEALESKMSDITGKEAGLFVTSGTMGNLLSVLSHCSRRGSEVLLGDKCHIFHTEQANIVQFGGVQPHILPTCSDGTFCMELLTQSLRSDDFHYPRTELICIENTHGQLGGRVVPLDWIDKVTEFANNHLIPVHLDGARIFNASLASGYSVSRVLSGVSSASICLSKGLGAPVGTVIVGRHSFIERARRLRKGIGGGWRQAGILAAAGLYALENNICKLTKDHENARIIAEGICNMNSSLLHVDLESVQTNMIMVHLDCDRISVEDFCLKMAEVSKEEKRALGTTISVQACPYTAKSFRLVTYLNISKEDAQAVLSKLRYLVERLE